MSILVSTCAYVCTQLCLTLAPRTGAQQAHLYIGFSRQEYWSGLTFPTPGVFPTQGIKPSPLTSPSVAGEFFITSAT